MIALITKVLIILLAPGGFLYGGYLLGKHVQKKINDETSISESASNGGMRLEESDEE